MKKTNEKEKEKNTLTKDKCLSNLNIPLFINYTFKDFLSFTKKQFITKDNDLLILLRLYKEICIIQKDDSEKSFNIFLSDESIEKMTTEEISYLLQNIKRLLYLMLDEIKQENNIENKYNNITNENSLLYFIKKNFSIFISLFKNGGYNDKNKTKNEKELDEKFMNLFGLNIDISEFIGKNDNTKINDKNKMEIEEEEEEITISNPNKIDYSNDIKIEIINIYNTIISTYKDLEKPDESIISFSQVLVKHLIINLNKDDTKDLLTKIKKSLSLLLGLYINVIKTEKFINHPIRTIFQEVFNFIIKLILFSEIKEDNKKEIEKYYQYLLSVYNILLNENKEKLLIDMQNSILYYSKQLIYENVDSAEFKSPLELKVMNTLNDIDIKIIFHPYLFNLLSFLDEEYAKSFFGFFIKFLIASEKNELCCCQVNLIKCLNYLIKIKWVDEGFYELIKIIKNKNTNFEKIKKIIEYIFLYLKTHKLVPEKNEKEIDSKKKAEEKLQFLYKNIILENINALN